MRSSRVGVVGLLCPMSYVTDARLNPLGVGSVSHAGRMDRSSVRRSNSGVCGLGSLG